MKCIIQNFLLSITLFTSSVSMGQSLYKPGFVVNNNGDTIQGWIEYLQWERNPDIIHFRNLASDDKPNSYTVNDLNYFEITGLDRYVKAVVMKDTRPVEINRLPMLVEDTLLRDTVFLRVLLEAPLSLYELYDSKPHYYIKNKEEDFEELQYKVYLVDSDTRVLRSYIFRGQLEQLLIAAGKSDVSVPRLRTAEYREREILNLVKKLNEILYNSSYSYVAPKPKLRASFFAGAGLAFSKIKYTGEADNLSNLDYSSSTQPLFSAGVDIPIGRNLQQLVFRAELSWYSLKYKGFGHRDVSDSVTYNLKASNLSPSLSLLYNFVNRDKNKLYLGVGVAYNLTTYPENSLTLKTPYNMLEFSPHLDLEKGWLSFNARAGYILNRKFELATMAKLGGSFSNYTSFGLGPHIVCASLNYHF